MNRMITLLAITLASQLLSGSANAQAVAKATVGNVVITLTDLDPLDGITPWIEYDQSPWSVSEVTLTYADQAVPGNPLVRSGAVFTPLACPRPAHHCRQVLP